MTRTAQSVMIIYASLCVGRLSPAAEPYKITPDVVYGHKSGLALTFDVIANQEKPNGAGVLFMMSGGWFSTWVPPHQFLSPRAPAGLTHFRDLVDKGYTLFIVRHGSAPQFKVPEAVEDVRRAVRHIRLHAKAFNVDPRRLGACGASAGGHLALMLGTASDDGDEDANDVVERIANRVAAVVAYFPPVDLREWVGPSEQFPALEFDPELAEDVSPLLHVTSDDPPTLLIHGNKDDLVPVDNSLRIHEAFESEGVLSKLIVFDGAGHGFSRDQGQRASDALLAWFDDHLASSAPREFAGLWQPNGEETRGGELECVAQQVAGHHWEATFSGYCDRQFVYQVKMIGRQQGDRIMFSGSADLGEGEGIYNWTGELVGATFTGEYTSEIGKSGTFEMKPAQDVASPAR